VQRDEVRAGVRCRGGSCSERQKQAEAQGGWVVPGLRGPVAVLIRSWGRMTMGEVVFPRPRGWDQAVEPGRWRMPREAVIDGGGPSGPQASIGYRWYAQEWRGIQVEPLVQAMAAEGMRKRSASALAGN